MWDVSLGMGSHLVLIDHYESYAMFSKVCSRAINGFRTDMGRFPHSIADLECIVTDQLMCSERQCACWHRKVLYALACFVVVICA